MKNRENGVENTRARFQEPIKVDEGEASSLVADPLRLNDCFPAADGAASVVLARREQAARLTDYPVTVLASEVRSGRGGAYRYDEITTFGATLAAAESVNDRASVTPDDLDLVELHDCFTPAKIGNSEDLELFPKGAGGQAVREGRTPWRGDADQSKRRAAGKRPIHWSDRYRPDIQILAPAPK